MTRLDKLKQWHNWQISEEYRNVDLNVTHGWLYKVWINWMIYILYDKNFVLAGMMRLPNSK